VRPGKNSQIARTLAEISGQQLYKDRKHFLADLKKLDKEQAVRLDPSS